MSGPSFEKLSVLRGALRGAGLRAVTAQPGADGTQPYAQCPPCQLWQDRYVCMYVR